MEDEGIYFIEDLKSANGTFLNREKIEDAIELKSNDLINIGTLKFLFIQGDEDE